MTDSGSSDLKSTLGAFVLPQTGRPLSGPGASFDLERRGTGWHATLKLGFPLAASGGALIEALRLHCASALARLVARVHDRQLDRRRTPFSTG